MVKTIKGLNKEIKNHQRKANSYWKKSFELLKKQNALVKAGKWDTKAFKNVEKRRQKWHAKSSSESSKVTALMKQAGALTLKKMAEHNKKSLSARKRALKRRK